MDGTAAARPANSAPFRIAAGQFRQVSSDDFRFARQMGVSGVSFNALDLDALPVRRTLGMKHRPNGLQRGHWDYDDLCRLRETVERHGLTILSMENVPARMSCHIKAGDEHREAQLDDYCRTIENLGRAGIGVLGYEFMLLPVLRSSFGSPTRGDARTSSFYPDDFRGRDWCDTAPVSSEEVWERYTYFIRRIVPVAESAGVKLAMHPDDPPFAELGGVARNFGSKAGFERALGLVDSPNHGLNFCVGTFAEADVDHMYDALDHFTRAGKVFCVHFRNIQRDGDGFIETFVDDGVVDVVRTMRILIDGGFDGFLMDDHVPVMVGDEGWRHRGRAFCTGYIMGLLRSAVSGSDQPA